MVKSFNIYSKEEIERMVQKKIQSNLDFVYKEIEKLRERILDIDRIIKKKDLNSLND